jgi:hypothetical protein
MAELKTKQNNADVSEFINSFADTEQKRKDSFYLLKLMQEFTGFEPKMWGSSIIGFGSYHYKSERSTQEGDWPLTGFSPRKQHIAIYIMSGVLNYKDLLGKLGKFKVSSGSCIYVKKIEDISLDVLKELISASVSDMKKKYNLG